MMMFSFCWDFEPSKGFQFTLWLAVLSLLCLGSQAYCHARTAQSCSTPLPPLWCVLAANQLCLQRMFFGCSGGAGACHKPKSTASGNLVCRFVGSSRCQTAHPAHFCEAMWLCVWSVKCPSWQGVTVIPVDCLEWMSVVCWLSICA